VDGPAGAAYSAPQSPSWIKGSLLLREGREVRKSGGRKKDGRGRKERESERKVEFPPAPLQFDFDYGL